MGDSAGLLRASEAARDSDVDDDESADMLNPFVDDEYAASERLLDFSGGRQEAASSRSGRRMSAGVAGALAALVVVLVLAAERRAPAGDSHARHAKVSLSGSAARRSSWPSRLDAETDAEDATEVDPYGYPEGDPSGGQAEADVQPVGRIDYGSSTHYDWSQVVYTTTSVRTTTTVPCGWVEQDFFYAGNDLQEGSKVPEAEECCSQCAEVEDCVAWSWERSTWACALKGSKPRASITKLSDERYVSGQPTQVRSAVPLSVPQEGQSLFCFSLMMPFGYEPVLLGWQFEHGVSIFACDEYAVYSNVTLTVAPGLATLPVASSLVCAKGGEFKTALNTDIFIAVWTRVVSDGRFRFHDWTVKIDPDAVFMVQRLRGYLSRHRERADGLYLNNCRRGLHGPVEVLSRKAVEVWWAGIPTCQAHFRQLCSGPCEWGEDMWLDQCLQKVLGVGRVDEVGLLLEENCDPPAGWQSCQSTAAAVFHPFKDIATYSGCHFASQR